MITIGCDRPTAQKVYDAYWGLNWAIPEIVGEQSTQYCLDKMWLWNPIAKLWYNLKFEKDIFSTLVQGTADYVFNIWMGFVIAEREQLTGQFHDEFILEINEGCEKQTTELLRRAIDKTNEILNLNRELDIDIQFGKRYSEIH